MAKGLIKAGDDVRLVTHQNFEILVKSHGLEFWPADLCAKIRAEDGVGRTIAIIEQIEK